MSRDTVYVRWLGAYGRGPSLRESRKKMVTGCLVLAALIGATFATAHGAGLYLDCTTKPKTLAALSESAWDSLRNAATYWDLLRGRSLTKRK
jgi:hypothetical protein